MTTNTILARAGVESATTAFDGWAETYDSQINPLLTLEERLLKCIMPECGGLDVVDVGCGTGRWLTYLADMHPRSLTGFDPSAEMLALARQKIQGRAELSYGCAEQVPLPDSCADVVLCSFVTSYADPEPLVRELCRIARPGARILLSDVHPRTAERLKWKRAFHKAGNSIELPAHTLPVEELTSLFERVGMLVRALLEASFADAEHREFTAAGMEREFWAAEGHPAIYILQLEKPEPAYTAESSGTQPNKVALAGGMLALGATEGILGTLTIEDRRIESLRSDLDSRKMTCSTIDLDGYLVYPGLINAHDHLEFALFPRLGAGPYRNAEEWAMDIHRAHAEVIARHRKVPRSSRLLWGALRNLLCGVTTVCQHNPPVPELLEEDFPVRVLSEVRWAHSLAFDTQGVVSAIQGEATTPFVMHVGEGIDEKSAAEIYELDRRGGLDSRTVVVHGIAFGAKALDLLNGRGGALVWCPSSNALLFGRTHTRRFLREAKRLAIGSDSPLTAIGDLLDEVSFARERVGLSPRELYEQLTTRAAEAFNLHDSQGSIRPGGMADLFAVRQYGQLPADALANASFRKVELVIVGGEVQLASDEMIERLPSPLTSGLRPLEVEGEQRWVRMPLGRMFADAHGELGCDIRLGGKRVRHVSTAWL